MDPQILQLLAQHLENSAILPTPCDIVRTQAQSGPILNAGVAEMQGWRNSHEDAHFVQQYPAGDGKGGNGWAVAAVLDGHGGSESAELAAKMLPLHMKTALKGRNANEGVPPGKVLQAFVKCDDEIKEKLTQQVEEDKKNALKKTGGSKAAASKGKGKKGKNGKNLSLEDELPSGTTVTSCGVKRDAETGKHTVFLANAGDSRGIIVRFIKDEDVAEELKKEEMMRKSAKSKKSTEFASCNDSSEGGDQDDSEKGACFIEEITDEDAEKIKTQAAAKKGDSSGKEKKNKDEKKSIDRSKVPTYAMNTVISAHETPDSGMRMIEIEGMGWVQYLASRDHKPSRSDEKQRILRANGFVSNGQDDDDEETEKAKNAEGPPALQLKGANASYDAIPSEEICNGNKDECSTDDDDKDDSEDKETPSKGPQGPPARLDGNLAVSRGFGDFSFKQEKGAHPGHQKVSCLPEFYQMGELEDGALVILACDGIYDVMTTEDVVKFVVGEMKETSSAKTKSDSLAGIAEKGIRKCLELGSKDNMTLAVMELGNTNKKSSSTPTDDSTSKTVTPVNLVHDKFALSLPTDLNEEEWTEKLAPKKKDSQTTSLMSMIGIQLPDPPKPLSIYQNFIDRTVLHMGVPLTATKAEKDSSNWIGSRKFEAGSNCAGANSTSESHVDVEISSEIQKRLEWPGQDKLKTLLKDEKEREKSGRKHVVDAAKLLFLPGADGTSKGVSLGLSLSLEEHHQSSHHGVHGGQGASKGKGKRAAQSRAAAASQAAEKAKDSTKADTKPKTAAPAAAPVSPATEAPKAEKAEKVEGNASKEPVVNAEGADQAGEANKKKKKKKK